MRSSASVVPSTTARLPGTSCPICTSVCFLLSYDHIHTFLCIYANHVTPQTATLIPRPRRRPPRRRSPLRRRLPLSLRPLPPLLAVNGKPPALASPPAVTGTVLRAATGLPPPPPPSGPSQPRSSLSGRLPRPLLKASDQTTQEPNGKNKIQFQMVKKEHGSSEAFPGLARIFIYFPGCLGLFGRLGWHL